MTDIRWTNRGHPQTLQNAVFLLYLNAAFSLLLPRSVGLFTVFAIVGSVAAGLGIAQSKKWGWRLGVVVAALPIVVVLAVLGFDAFRPQVIISVIFDIAMLALLLHPHSREYQRLWFD